MQAKDFAKKLFFFLLPIIILYGVLCGILYRAGYYPLITNSISLDAKLLDHRAHKFNNIDVLAIGSSATLNNVASSEIKLPDKAATYYNFGAWGLKISDISYLVKYLSNIYDIKCVIVSSSLKDFRSSGGISIPKYYELNLVNDYLPYFYLKSNPLSILYRHDLSKAYKARTDGYDNLNFDECGATVLNIPPDMISQSRWSAGLGFPGNDTEYLYSKLKELALYLKNRNIAFLFVQAPIRRALAESNDAIIRAHSNRCKTIVGEYGGYYLDLHNPLIYDDSLFVDQSHLSAAGAKIYTRQISRRLSAVIAKRVAAAMLGDSITAKSDWCKLLGRADVVGMGVGMDTTEKMLKRLHKIDGYSPGICFIMAGINDIHLGIPLNVTFENYKEIIVRLKKHNVVPVIQSTLYTLDQERNIKVSRLNELLKNYSEENNIEYIDLNSLLSENSLLKKEYTYDGLHLLANAYILWAQKIENVLKKYNL